MKLGKYWITVLLSLAIGMSLTAGTNDVLLDSANQAYKDGLYSQALENYLKIYEDGYTSSELCYNIGNTYFKLDQLPSAILFYERALRLDPSDEDIIFNLELSRSQIIDKIEAVPQLFFIKWWHQLRDIYGADGWARASLITFILFLSFLLAFLIIRSTLVKRIVFWPALFALIVFIHTLAFSWQKSYMETQKPEAIIFKPTVTVKSSPDKESVDLFVIHEGTKVVITDHLGQWLEVKIASGSKGWVEESTLERI